jgi:hypothetical protein
MLPSFCKKMLMAIMQCCTECAVILVLLLLSDAIRFGLSRLEVKQTGYTAGLILSMHPARAKSLNALGAVFLFKRSSERCCPPW